MTGALDSVRKPAYTGSNRCWPCTVVNLGLLAVACLAVGLLAWPLAVVLGAVGAGVVYLRGYLVPYTPRFAPQLTARLPGDPFHMADGGTPVDGHDGGDSLATRGEDIDGETLMEALLSAGVLRATDEGGLELSEEFRAEWTDAMATYREMEPSELGARLRLLSGAASVETTTQDGGHIWYHQRGEDGALTEDGLIERTIAIAEIGALDALEGTVDDEAVRRQAVEPLRMFLETCPVCTVPLEETSTLDCCGGPVNPKKGPQQVLACPECDRSLYTFPA